MEYSMKITEILEKELDFISDALQAYFYQSIKELSKSDLGDIERKNWEGIKKKSKEIIKHL